MGQLVEQVKGILNEATFAIHVYEIVGKGLALIYASFDEMAMEFLAYRWSLMSGTGLQLVDKVRVAHSSPLLTQFDVEVRETLYIFSKRRETRDSVYLTDLAQQLQKSCASYEKVVKNHVQTNCY